MGFPDRIERTVEVAHPPGKPEDADRTEYDAHTQGWARELGELAGYLDAA